MATGNIPRKTAAQREALRGKKHVRRHGDHATTAKIVRYGK